MSSAADGGSQPECWQIAASRDLFCDFGRKLETLSVSYFRTTEQNKHGLLQFATQRTTIPPSLRELFHYPHKPVFAGQP